MIRTKHNFKPLLIAAAGAGDSLNKDIIQDGSVLVASVSDKVTLDTINKMSKLDAQTPFAVSDIPPELVE